jgi:hypothetical protein
VTNGNNSIFKIDNNGNAEFNGSGTFSGKLTAATGNFKGLVEFGTSDSISGHLG